MSLICSKDKKKAHVAGVIPPVMKRGRMKLERKTKNSQVMASHLHFNLITTGSMHASDMI